MVETKKLNCEMSVLPDATDIDGIESAHWSSNDCNRLQILSALEAVSFPLGLDIVLQQ